MAISQQAQPASTGRESQYQETPEQTAQWKRLRKHIRDTGVGIDETFRVKGRIVKVLTNNGGLFYEERKDQKGNPFQWGFLKWIVALDDFGEIELPPKKISASFFDGWMNRGGQRSRTPVRGGMYSLHLAATGQEPPQELVDSRGEWDPDDYIGKPLLVEIVYKGRVEEGSQYYGSKANLTVFLNALLVDREVHKPQVTDDDDDDDDLPPFAPTGGQGVGTTPSAAVLAPTPARVNTAATAQAGATGTSGIMTREGPPPSNSGIRVGGVTEEDDDEF